MSAATLERALEVMGVEPERRWTTGQVAARIGCLPEAGRRAVKLAVTAGQVRRCENDTYQLFDVRGAILAHLLAHPGSHYMAGRLADELPELNLSRDEMAAHLLAMAGGGTLELWACLPDDINGWYEIHAENGAGKAAQV